jgi:hypothetical protein
VVHAASVEFGLHVVEHLACYVEWSVKKKYRYNYVHDCTGVFVYTYCTTTKCTSYSGSEIPGKFQNVLLENDVEDQIDRSCEEGSVTEIQGREEYPTDSKQKEGQLDWLQLA